MISSKAGFSSSRSEEDDSPSQEKKCRLRDLGNNKKICVCDSNYCDTIPRPKKVEKPQYLLYISSKDGLRFFKTGGRFQNHHDRKQKNEIYIDRKTKFQTIKGWGGAFTDATGINIKQLPQQAQNLLMKSYFSEEGVEYSWCRIPIAGTDFSTRYYTYNDLEDGEKDFELKKFALAPEDFKYKIPFIKKALEIRKNDTLEFFGSPWGAPKWMKTNNAFYGYGFIKKDNYRVWAEYFVKFLEAYAEQGIHVGSITTQNEPSLPIIDVIKIPSVAWPSFWLSKWLKNDLIPTIKNSKFPGTNIMILDDQKLFLPWYTNAVLHDPEVRKSVHGIGIHWYLAAVTPCNAMTTTHNIFPEIFIASTEASSNFQTSDGPDLGNWENGEAYSADIIEDMDCWVVAWVDWNMVLNLQGGPTMIDNFVDAPIVVNTTSGEFYKQPTYYHIGHHSKFVPAGSVRIEVKLKLNDTMKVVAYERPDKGIAVVILNKSENEETVKVVDSLVGAAELKIKKRSINTLLYW